MYHRRVPSKQHTSAEAKLAAVAELRAQVRQEIMESKKLCAYGGHPCTQLRIDGYDYCYRHILEDPNAPFKQCTYVYSTNGKKCHLPAPKSDKQGLCQDHLRKTHIMKTRTIHKTEPVESTETILESLTHYVKPASSSLSTRHRTFSGNSDSMEVGNNKSRTRTLSGTSISEDEMGRISPEDNDTKVVTKSLDPFVEIDASKVNASCSDILGYASESESDIEPTVYGNVWHGAHGEMSDDESIDSESEDPLKHAGVYTAEEVILIARDKMVQLQDLYTKQFHHLQMLLRDKRRKYLNSLKKEKESLASIHNQVRDNPKELRLYKKLKALNHYQKSNGVEAILQKRATELRAKPEGASTKPSPFNKCIFTEGGVKCGNRTLPLAKHCVRHILNDPHQVLFKACDVETADVRCHEPVPNVFPGQTCIYHTNIPVLKSYTHMKKDEEDTDYEDSNENVDGGNSFPQRMQKSFKHEIFETSLTSSENQFNISNVMQPQDFSNILKQEKMENSPSHANDFASEDVNIELSGVELEIDCHTETEIQMDELPTT